MFVSLITADFTEALPGTVFYESWQAHQLLPSAAWFTWNPLKEEEEQKSPTTLIVIFHILEAFLLSIQLTLKYF